MIEKADCVLVRPGSAGSYEGKQGFTYFEGIAAENTGAKLLCMHLLTIPPGGRANAHLHEGHESGIYVISGQAEMWYGDDLSQHMIVRAGDFLYIPAGMPHLPWNTSADTPCVAVISRSDPNEQESVVVLPELEAEWARRLGIS
jgi:uncharacterized RmlC-like cupin family protein